MCLARRIEKDRTTYPYDRIENEQRSADCPSVLDRFRERFRETTLAPLHDHEQLGADCGHEQPDVLAHPHRFPGCTMVSTIIAREKYKYERATVPRVIDILVEFSHGGEGA